MNRVPAALVFATGGLLIVTPALADGRLPPRPYHYLHPPAALARSNSKPSSGSGSVAVLRGRSSKLFFLFTADGQAGVQIARIALATSTATRTIQVRITPINVPPGLPRTLAPDGNAYNVSATALPRHTSVALSHSIQLFIGWPHIPTAVYAYRAHRWTSLCRSAHWTLSFSSVACSTSTLGVFLAISAVKK